MVKKLLFLVFILGLIGLRLAYDVYFTKSKGVSVEDLAAQHLQPGGLSFVVLMDGITNNCQSCFEELNLFAQMEEAFPETRYLALAKTDFEKETLGYFGIEFETIEVDQEAVRSRYHLNEGTKIFVLDREFRIICILPLAKERIRREQLYYSLLNAY